MRRPPAAETKLVLYVHHAFTLWRVPGDFPERIRKSWPGIRIVHLTSAERLSEEIADADIYVGYWSRPDAFRHALKLRWVHATAAGVGGMLHPDFVASDVILTNARGVNAGAIGDHALAVMLACSRRLPSAWRYQRERRWAQQEIWDEKPRPKALEGERLVLVGLGSLGREIAVRARSFGMKITAVTRSGRAGEGLVDEAFTAERLDEALGEADFVVLAAPETAETVHLIDAGRLRVMKPGAYLVNVARGKLVDEQALVEALRERRIAGAALDVAEHEPLAPESPLWEMENVLITPHIANAGEQLWERQWEVLAENLERWFAGRELINVVEKRRGY